MENEYKTWGVKYQPHNPDISHSLDFECLECGWKYSLAGLKRYDSIVGFHLLDVPEFGFLRSTKKIGILIVECPECFSKFWVHAMEDSAKYAKEYSSKWPK